MSDARLTELADVWAKSIDTPSTPHEIDDPISQTGLCVIRPGEYVPEEGWISHEGGEISTILNGEVEPITSDGEYSVSSGAVSVIPAGVKHCSVNDTDKPTRFVYTVVGDL